MNCRDIKPLLFAERDGALTEDQRAGLERHVAACPECRRLRSALAASAESWRGQSRAVAVPPVEREWQAVRRRIRNDRRPPVLRIPRLVWTAGVPLAAACLVVLFSLRPAGSGPEFTQPAMAEYVETDDPEAATIVYVDQSSGWLIVWAENAPDGGSI